MKRVLTRLRASVAKSFLLGLVMLAAPMSALYAQPLDDVSLEYQSQGVVATIRLTGPVQYLRHFPESHGNTLEIYYDRVLDATSNETWQDNEVRHSPPSRLIPGFTVTTRNQQPKCDQQDPRDQQTKCDQQTKPKLVIEFSREAEFSVAPGKDNRTLLITIRPDKQPVSEEPLPFLPAIRPEAVPAAGATLKADEVAAAEINKEARALMVQGREALAANNNEAAVYALNKLLLLPPNAYTQDGQEWVGVARERAGQPDKAKVEYDLYLRLYPGGSGAARVAQRLDGLSGSGRASKPMAVVPEKKKQAASMMAFGSVTSRYYFGTSKSEYNYTFNNAPMTDTQSYTDQSMLITSVDASERYRSENYDGRLVFRDTDTRSFLSSQPSRNRVTAAYGEIKGRTQNYLMRVGRQSSSGAGVLGRFDGLAGSYGEAQDMRVNAVAGSLADFSQGGKPRFFGASVDRGAFSFYGINQTVDGVLDRRAVGTEFRYFDDKKTAFGLLDYDAYFKTVNAAQFMGMSKLSDFKLLPNAMLSVMVDHRKTPSLSIRNALNGAATSSVSDLQQATSASSLRNLALARTATSNMGQVGITVPLREKWQVGGDFRLSKTTGLEASGATALEGILAATPSRGTERSVSGQVIGSGLAKLGDIWSGSLTFSSSSAANGHSLFFYNHTQFISGWMMDVSLQLSGYKDQFGGTTSRTSPMLRGTYRLNERFTIDADCGYERINYDGTQMSSRTQRLFMSGGVRWDF
jgi:hypothetical protein